MGLPQVMEKLLRPESMKGRKPWPLIATLAETGGTFSAFQLNPVSNTLRV